MGHIECDENGPHVSSLLLIGCLSVSRVEAAHTNSLQGFMVRLFLMETFQHGTRQVWYGLRKCMFFVADKFDKLKTNTHIDTIPGPWQVSICNCL